MLAVVIPAAWAQELESDNLAGDAEVAHVITSSRLLMGEQKTEWIESMREETCHCDIVLPVHLA